MVNQIRLLYPVAYVLAGGPAILQKMTPLETVKFAEHSLYATRMGMGCWAVGGHGWGRVDVSESIAAIQHAFDRGVTFFDTADVYGLGKSERMLSRVLGKRLRFLFVASKGGVRWDEAGRVWSDSSVNYLAQAVEASLCRLKIEQIPLYYLHKPDNKTPISEAIGGLVRLREQGKIGEIGVSNFSHGQLKEALAVAPIRAVQVQFNVLRREFGEGLAPLCRKHNIRLVAWGALADGLLTGKFHRGTSFCEDDHRSRLPDFQGQLFVDNLRRVEMLGNIAKAHGVSLSQLALRWIMDRYEWACPLFGAKNPAQVEENLGADGWRLTYEDMAAIDEILGVRKTPAS